MRTILHSLMWKEWHEHKWKVASILAILSAPAIYAILKTNSDPDLVFVLTMFCLAPLAVFVGLGTAASEQSHRTIDFLQALPVPMRQVALYKIVFGLFTVILPVLLTVLLVLLWTLVYRWFGWQQADLLNWTARISGTGVAGSTAFSATIISFIAAVSLYIWSAALGVNRKDEVSAGAVALGGMIGWWCLLIVLWYLFIFNSQGSAGVERLIAFGLGTAPVGATALPAFTREGYACWFGLVSAIAIHTALVVRYVRRFGQVDYKAYSPRGQVVNSNLAEWRPTAWRSPLAAMIWKQARESGPIVSLGLVGLVVTTTFLVVVSSFSLTIRSRDIAEVIAVASQAFGYIVAIVVGIGVCLYDLGPRLNTFWRSRPIRPDALFWVKYLTGGAVLVVGLYVPLLLAKFLMPTAATSNDVFRNALLFAPAVQLAVYAAAVALTCLVRHAVYAAILSVPTAFAGILLMRTILRMVERLNGPTPLDVWWNTPIRIWLAGLAIGFVICSLVAWLAFRFDWGRKSRY